MRPFSPRRRLCAAFAALALAGCGGGVYFSVGIGPDDDPPDVSLAASVNTAVPGQIIRLVAAASDDYGVDFVAFYRLDPGGRFLLAEDGASPYQFDTVVPNVAAGTSVRYVARAYDGAGQARDSQVVSVLVQ
jgi:hypothetical protein